MDDYSDYEDEDFEPDVDSGQTSQKPSAYYKATPGSNRVAKKKPKKTTGTGNSPMDRLLSSKDREFSELQNRFTVATRKLRELENENKTLKRLQIRHERELGKISSQEEGLPMILQKHAREVKSLREQIRRTQQNNSELQKKLTELSNELWRVNERKKKLESLTKRRDLMEREHLMMELQDTTETLRERDERIHDLERSVKLMDKTHSQEVRSLLAKQKQLTQQLHHTQEDMVQFRYQLKEKERLLDVTNIYSQRVPHNSILTPLPRSEDKGSQTPLTHPPHEGVVVLVNKLEKRTSEAQTDSKWLTDMLSPPKHMNKQSSDEDNGSLSIPTSTATSKQPLPSYTAGNITATKPFGASGIAKQQKKEDQTFIPPLSNPTVGVAQISLPVNSTESEEEEDKPLLDLSKQGTPATQPHMEPKDHSQFKPQPDIQLSPQHHPPSRDTTRIKEILFNNQQGGAAEKKKTTVQGVSLQTPPLSDATPKKGELGSKEKEELMKKLFSNSYKTEKQEGSINGPMTAKPEDRVGKIGRDNGIMDGYSGVPARDNGLMDGYSGVPARPRDNGLLGLKEKDNSIVRQRNEDSARQANTLTEVFTGKGTTDRSTAGLFNGGPVLGGDRGQHASSHRPQGLEKNQLLSQVFETPKRTEESTRDKSTDSKSSTSVSALSREERFMNMHQGLPSMASDDDPYGTKRRRSSAINLIAEGQVGQPRYGRRAVDEKGRGMSVNSPGFIFGQMQPTNRTFGSQRRTDNGNNPVFGSLSNPSESRQGGGAYSWESRVDLNAQSRIRGQNKNTLSTEDEVEELVI